jgi:nucleotide-binding universal stress UspA family protein
MKQVQKILFPIDFAANFDTLVPWVKTFADKFGATVYVLFVAQDLSHFATFYVPHGNIEDFQQQAIDSARKRMTAAAEEFFKPFPKLETRVELGSPAEKILAFVQKEKIDMIIMGAHGRSGLDRVIFGSVANKVVKSASCPVLTVHP